MASHQSFLNGPQCSATPQQQDGANIGRKLAQRTDSASNCDQISGFNPMQCLGYFNCTMGGGSLSASRELLVLGFSCSPVPLPLAFFRILPATWPCVQFYPHPCGILQKRSTRLQSLVKQSLLVMLAGYRKAICVCTQPWAPARRSPAPVEQAATWRSSRSSSCSSAGAVCAPRLPPTRCRRRRGRRQRRCRCCRSRQWCRSRRPPL